MLIGRYFAVAVKFFSFAERDFELESDERGERLFASQDDVVHSRLPASFFAGVVPGNNDLIGFADKSAHKTELLQHLGSEEPGENEE